MTNPNELKFDVAVIGGGPAGLMAAGRAAELGASVVLIEKNTKFGQKLLLTGKGRCNITHAEFDNRKLAEQYGKEGKVLLSPLSVFAPKDTINFFEKLGIKTKIERGQRVFPEKKKAADVLNSLITYLKKNKVEIIVGAQVVGLKKNSAGKITHLTTSDKHRIIADNYIICTGGRSYHKLGSTGDGFRWASKLGHTIKSLRPSLVPMTIDEKWIKEVQGLSLKNVRLTAFQEGKKISERFGEMIFTHFGVSGPIVLNMSKEIGRSLEKKKAKLFLDLKPALSEEELDKRIQRDFKKHQNKLFRNSLEDLLPQKLIPIIVRLSGINLNKKVHSVTKEERKILVDLLKGLGMTVTGLMGFERAIVTSGGVSLKEIDFKTMKSKIVDNLFFAGEIIDLDGPCGGFNLQICWTTGYVAGQSAATLTKSK